ncbi:chymotrypsin-like protease CTRL-1 [Drosophila teissieri]|uniref:chymotrypsin-like protease CTRL-1 n=1 Tax=Drosophila teissieri TaxID=7243 RepID=UPI001CB9E0DE|nr:chymotrypsin-like protease CTRL-1 [Drosophila teissieri]
MNAVLLGFTCILLPLLGSTQFLDMACGIRAPNPPALRAKNATIASLTSSPWMAFLHSTDDRFICGGSLITNRLVLTAAHCFLERTQLIARLGEYDRDVTEMCHDSYCTYRLEAFVERGFKHRLYRKATMAHDIAILRLYKKVQYTDSIRPICIVTDTRWRHYIDSLNPLTGTGWGRTEFEPDSGKLRSVDLARKGPEVCQRYAQLTLTSNQFCAGNEYSNLCNGDSGGPLGTLIPFGKTKRFIQVGIASFTNPQCLMVSAFTDVLSYIDWIRTVHNYRS